MFRVLIAFAQMADDVVRAQVDVESEEEDDDTDDELRRPKPRDIRVGKSQHVIILLVRLEENPVALHHGVQNVEGDAHKHDRKGHLALLSFHQPWENE